MIRILIIDDAQKPDFIEAMCKEVSSTRGGVQVDSLHLNPVNLLASEAHQGALEALLEKISTTAQEFWDVIIVDINLAEVNLPDEQRLHLALSIAEKVRETNNAATVILYSGTLADYVDKLMKGQMPPEAALKRIFRAEISAFVPRRRIEAEVLYAIDNPSWLLRVDRLLMKYAKQVVGPEEAEFKGRSFADLAMAVRRQDHDGQKISQLTAEFGIGCFADLNS
jgi:hypothetical protein